MRNGGNGDTDDEDVHTHDGDVHTDTMRMEGKFERTKASKNGEIWR